MNNSKFAIDFSGIHEVEPAKQTEQDKEREADLVQIIESLRAVAKTKEWRTLKTKLFDHLPKDLERMIQTEARKAHPDVLLLNRYAGQLKWAEKFSDLEKLSDIFKLELDAIKSKSK